MDYQIAIASYGRQDTIQRATLRTLQLLSVDPELITIFVPNDEHLREYQRVLGNKYRVVVSAPGLVQSQLFFHAWYSEKYGRGTRLIRMDDDIWGLRLLSTQGNTGKKLELYDGEFDSIANTGFRLSESVGARLWGGTLEARPQYLSQTATIGNVLIAGGLQGCYSSDPMFLSDSRPNLESFDEDAETSIQSFLTYGANVRLEYLSLWTKPATTGGMSADMVDRLGAKDENEAIRARETVHLAAFSSLAQRYPGIVALGVDPDRGTMELNYSDSNNVEIPRGVVETQFGNWKG
jgi:hypothetical protein